jgi:hypothetical protein
MPRSRSPAPAWSCSAGHCSSTVNSLPRTTSASCPLAPARGCSFSGLVSRSICRPTSTGCLRGKVFSASRAGPARIWYLTSAMAWYIRPRDSTTLSGQRPTSYGTRGGSPRGTSNSPSCGFSPTTTSTCPASSQPAGPGRLILCPGSHSGGAATVPGWVLHTLIRWIGDGRERWEET